MDLSLSAVASFVKTASKVFKEAQKIELQNMLLSIQDQLIDLSAENLKLHSEKVSLKKKLELKGTLRFKDNSFSIMDKKGQVKDGPYCSPC